VYQFALSAEEQEDVSRWEVQTYVIEVMDREVQVLSKQDLEERRKH
jgi:hypothetical protein